MEKQLVFAGFGGQGVLTAGMLVANIGAALDKEVTWIPSYGSEMRGGTANCSVKVSDEPIASPFVKSIDILVVMNEPSMMKFLPSVKDGGLMIVDTSIIKDVPTKDNISIVKVPATDLCQKERYGRGANICMLGVLSAACKDLYEKEDFESGIKEFFSKGSKGSIFEENNMMAFNVGYDYIK